MERVIRSFYSNMAAWYWIRDSRSPCGHITRRSTNGVAIGVVEGAWKKVKGLAIDRDYISIHACLLTYRWHSPRLLTCPSKDVKSSTLANQGTGSHARKKVMPDDAPYASCLLRLHVRLVVTWRNVDAFRELFFLAPWSVPRVRPITCEGNIRWRRRLWTLRDGGRFEYCWRRYRLENS